MSACLKASVRLTSIASGDSRRKERKKQQSGKGVEIPSAKKDEGVPCGFKVQLLQFSCMTCIYKLLEHCARFARGFVNHQQMCIPSIAVQMPNLLSWGKFAAQDSYNSTKPHNITNKTCSLTNNTHCPTSGLVERGERRDGRRDSPRFRVVSEMPRSGQIGERQTIH